MIARIITTALSKEATVPQFEFLSFGSVLGRSFRLWLSWFRIFTTRAIFGLIIIHPVNRIQYFVK